MVCPITSALTKLHIISAKNSIYQHKQSINQISIQQTEHFHLLSTLSVWLCAFVDRESLQEKSGVFISAVKSSNLHFLSAVTSHA